MHVVQGMIVSKSVSTGLKDYDTKRVPHLCSNIH